MGDVGYVYNEKRTANIEQPRTSKAKATRPTSKTDEQQNTVKNEFYII